MDVSRNFLYGVVALQANLIDTAHFDEFMEACTNQTAENEIPLVDMFVARGWIQPTDKRYLEELVERKLRQHAGDVAATLAVIRAGVEQTLTVLNSSAQQRAGDALPRPQPAPRFEGSAGGSSESEVRYTRTQLHATGGIGRVWVARDSHLGRDVALKELLPEQSGNSIACARFLREARITGQLEHPGIVPVYELSGSGTRESFYTMRFVKGRTMKEAALAYHKNRIEAHPDSLEFLNLLNAFVLVCKTVAYAHSRGVIHRDLKGQNVIVGDFGEVVVLDWGLAKVLGRPEIDGATPEGNAESRKVDNPDLTLDGDAVGTPAYMAPEQAAGRLDLIDERTDVYGLGATLYQILTGQAPFTGATAEEILKKVEAEQPLSPERHWPDVPPTLQAACLRALTKKPTERFASASELAQEVEQWQEVQRKKAEEELRVSQALYHSLVESIPLWVWRKDRDSRFTFANHAFSEGLGMKPGDLIGKTDYDFFPAELAERIRRDDAHVLKTGETLRITEERTPTVTGPRQVEVIKIPIRNSRGEIVGTQGVLWDMTAWKRASEEPRT